MHTDEYIGKWFVDDNPEVPLNVIADTINVVGDVPAEFDFTTEDLWKAAIHKHGFTKDEIINALIMDKLEKLVDDCEG